MSSYLPFCVLLAVLVFVLSSSKRPPLSLVVTLLLYKTIKQIEMIRYNVNCTKKLKFVFV